MSNLVNISSEYELIQVLTDLGINYFGEDLSTERIGMFGFITESMAHLYGAALFDSTIRSNEFSVKSAMKRNTLNYAAYKLGLDVPTAKPTTIEVFLGIKANDIIEFGKVVNTSPKTYKLVIEKDVAVTINEYVFKPEFDIELTALWSEETSQYVYSAQYLGYGDIDVTSNEDYVYPESLVSEDIKHEHIACYRTGNKTKIVLFKTRLKQLTKTLHEYVITENDTISLTGIDFDYQNQFSYFNIYYKEADSSQWTFMKAVPKYDTNAYEEKVIYYEVLDDDKKIRFDFTGFEPAYNATFRIEIFTTLGTVVNDLEYVGNGSDIQIKIDSPDNRHSYAGLSLACIPYYTNTTGTDTLTMDGLRNYIINHSSLLNAIITEPDITTYLNNEDPYNDYYVRKVRSDMVNMIFAVNAKLKNEDGGVIPTRSINTEAPRDKGTIWTAGTELDPQARYCSPFDLAYTDNGIQAYASNILKNVQMTVVDTDTTSTINFRIDHVTVSKDIGSNTYKLKVSVMTDGDYSKAMKGTDVNTGNVRKAIILRGFIYDAKTSNNVVGIFDFNFVSFSDDIFEFEADLDVEAYMDETNNTILRLNGMNLYNTNNLNRGASDINDGNEFIVDGALHDLNGIPIDATGFRFGVGCYYLMYRDDEEFEYINDSRMLVQVSGTGVNRVFTTLNKTIPGSGNAYPAYTGLCEYVDGTDNFDYKLCDVYSNTTDLVDLFVDMTNVVRIDIEDVEIDENTTQKQLIDVPCVDIDIVDDYGERLRDIVFYAKDTLAKVKSKLLNNFDVDYKFFNTSGDSKYFTISFSNGSNATPIVDLELTVSVHVGLTDHYATLDTTKLTEIKQSIKKNIETIFADSENGKLYIGNVMTNVQNEMKEYIKYIELESINGFSSQYRLIQYHTPQSTDAYVSEFISVPLDNITVNIE